MAAKINISISEELLQRVDDFAKANYMSRSAVFAAGANSFLATYEVRALINRLTVAVETVAKNNEIDEEAQQAFSEFEQMSQLLARSFLLK